MLKHVYRTIVMVAVFITAVYYYGMRIEVISVEHEKTVEVGGSTFPILYVKSQGYEMNRLFGFSGNLSSDTFRESITPLGANKTFDVLVKEYVEEIQKITYEVRDVKSDELLESGSISALKGTEEGKSTRIALETELLTSTEYSLKITTVTKNSRKIHYFTRVKYYMDDSYLKEKMDFVLRFHEDTFIKDVNKHKVGSDVGKQGIESYLEQTQLGGDNASLARVDIHSEYDLITWAGVKPKVVSKVIPTIKEFNIETGCFQLSYFIEVENRLGKRPYFVQEFYRLRFYSGQYYLLAFERTMEAVFKEDMLNAESGEIRLGVTSDTEREVVSNSNQSKISFVRDGSLYYYDLVKNEFSQVYSFYQDDVDYEQKSYPEHDIQILKMDEEGNIHFVVYGYMTRGDYEGKVAIVLYQYHVVENSIEELVYVPLQTTYQRLKEDFDKRCYMNAKDDFYFYLYNHILKYNTVAKSLNIVAENVSEDNFLVLKDNNCFVWADSIEGEGSEEVRIENLDTGNVVEIRGDETKGVKLLGTIDGNVVYGYYKKSDVVETTEGKVIVPVNQLEISDRNGEVLEVEKEEKKGYYYTDVSIHDSKIIIDRSKKVKQGNSYAFEKVDEHQLTSMWKEEVDKIELSHRASDDAVEEWYIVLPSVKKENKETTFSETKNYVISKDTTLHLDDLDKERVKYYVNAYGRITDSTEAPAEAIIQAYEKMGVVTSAKNRLVWERGGKFNNNSISGIEKTKEAGKLNSVKACTYMLLKSNHVSVDKEEVSKKKTSILGTLKEYLDDPVNLTGCTLDDVLYFVSSGKPVIGMTSKKDAVLIYGYEGTGVSVTGVNVINPKTGSEERWSATNATELFENAGNVFISFL